MFKMISKYIGIVVIAFLVLYLGYVVGWEAKHYLDNWKTIRKVDVFNNMILQIFKNDTYGGRTPEETYNLFVDALKKQDVDLAVKYFILDSERRARYQKEFNDKKQKGELEEYANNFPKWEEFTKVEDQESDWENQATIRYSQVVSEPITIYDPDLKKERVLPAGVYSNTIIFTKNLNIWKISSL